MKDDITQHATKEIEELPSWAENTVTEQAFMKFDTEKIRWELLDYSFIDGIAHVLTSGAKKYAAWNWQKADSTEDIERIKGAMMRHVRDYMRGDKYDKETGKSHLYHMGCCAMFLDYFDRKGEVHVG